MFLEIKKDVRTGKVETEREITLEELLKTFPHDYDLRSWAMYGRQGSPFSMLSKGLYYKKL